MNLDERVREIIHRQLGDSLRRLSLSVVVDNMKQFELLIAAMDKNHDRDLWFRERNAKYRRNSSIKRMRSLPCVNRGK